MNEPELSVSLYHEVLEAATVAAEHPPESVLEFNEWDFERAARAAHVRLGVASAKRLNQILVEFGFQEQAMAMKRSIEMLLLKLADGGRILRFCEPASGLCLEKRLQPDVPVARQKQRWERVFAEMLDRELGVAA